MDNGKGTCLHDSIKFRATGHYADRHGKLTALGEENVAQQSEDEQDKQDQYHRHW